MPFYEYLCTACHHEFEEMQKFSDPAIRKCPKCGKLKVQKQVSLSGFQLKGAGWYKDGYGKPAEQKAAGDKPAGDKSDTKSDDKKSEKKPEGGKSSESAKSSSSDTKPAPKAKSAA